MNLRADAVGKTRTCPHCRATILESAPVCPACRHHLRFEPRKPDQQAAPTDVALRVEGRFSHASPVESREYSVVVVVRDGSGAEIARNVVAVGALSPGEERAVDLTVEVSRQLPLAQGGSGHQR